MYYHYSQANKSFCFSSRLIVKNSIFSCKSIDKSQRKQRVHQNINKSFTLMELLIVITVIMLLITMLLPVLRIARERAREISCVNNLKQIGSGTYSYINDFNGYALPPILETSYGEILWLVHLYNEADYVGAESCCCPSVYDEQSFKPWGASHFPDDTLENASYVMNTIAAGSWNGAAISSDPDNSTGWSNNSGCNPIYVTRVKNISSKIYVTDAGKRPTEVNKSGWNSDLKGIVAFNETDHGPPPTTNAGKDFSDVGNNHLNCFNSLMGDMHAETVRPYTADPNQWVVVE